MISQNQRDFFISKIEYLISKNLFCDINSDDFLISQILLCDITKDFVISKKLFFDVTK